MSRLVRILPIALVLALVANAALAADHVVPSNAKPHGRSYGEWAAAWWQWALETPSSMNPLLDQTGANCAVNQSGQVWFLAGTLDGSSVSRSCTISTGTALFFPIANNFYGAFLTDPPATKTEEFLRQQVACVEGATLSASIDGKPVSDLRDQFEQSPLFTVQLPEDNVFGASPADVPQLKLTPAVDAGYYLFLNPLSPGQHTLTISSQSCVGTQNVTYQLIVVPGAH